MHKTHLKVNVKSLLKDESFPYQGTLHRPKHYRPQKLTLLSGRFTPHKSQLHN